MQKLIKKWLGIASPAEESKKLLERWGCKLVEKSGYIKFRNNLCDRCYFSGYNCPCEEVAKRYADLVYNNGDIPDYLNVSVSCQQFMEKEERRSSGMLC